MRLKMLPAIPFLMAAALGAPSDCPDGMPAGTTCYSDVDANGAYYLIAVPENYSRRLVLWAHGYDLNPPKPIETSDVQQLVPLLAEGFALAASSYRPDPVGMGGWAVADGAEDTENLRQLFVELVGAPDWTYLVGASEGGLVTATVIEKYGSNENGDLNYQGAMPMCGSLAGGRRNWYGGFDLRVVYQYFCQNLPRPEEDPYPLYLGLAPGSTMPPLELIGRVQECTGVLSPPDARTEEQQRNLANILGVVKIPEEFLVIDMGYATFAMQELVQVRTGFASPVTNLGVVYSGSNDDDGLNAGVFRTGADPDASNFLTGAYDPTGTVLIPTLNIHTIGDGLVIVENENAYRKTREDAGTADNLFQAYTNAGGHCEFSMSEAQAAFHSLVNWVETQQRPTRQGLADLCEQYRGQLGDTCNFNLEFEPMPFESRIPEREP